MLSAGGSSWQMTVRPMVREDIERVSNLLYASWHHAYSDILSPKRIDSIVSSIQFAMKYGDGQFPGYKVAVGEDSTIVGFMASRHLAFGRQVRIDMLYIHPVHQGRGIGTVLLDEGASIASVGFSISVEVLTRNAKAIAFYEARGFTKSHRWFSIIGLQPTWIMWKPHTIASPTAPAGSTL